MQSSPTRKLALHDIQEHQSSRKRAFTAAVVDKDHSGALSYTLRKTQATTTQTLAARKFQGSDHNRRENGSTGLPDTMGHLSRLQAGIFHHLRDSWHTVRCADIFRYGYFLPSDSQMTVLDFRRRWRKVKSEQHLHYRQATPSLTFTFPGVEYENGTPSPAPESPRLEDSVQSRHSGKQQGCSSEAGSEAEKAVLTPGREVFYGHASLEEKEALEDALYALRAFRTAWQHTEAA